MQPFILTSLACKVVRQWGSSATPLRASAQSALSSAVQARTVQARGIVFRRFSTTTLKPHYNYALPRHENALAPFRLYSTKVQGAAAGSHQQDDEDSSRYAWIDDEARELIAKAYARHKALADKSQSFPPSLSVKDLERIGTPYHYEPRDFIDRLALRLMKTLRVFVHAFFREKYDHHAVCLETVAAVPGLVGSFHRHLRSLRRMKRDHGWITVLQEEAENERMHLLIFMQVCQPSALERGLVVLAQGLYLSFYSVLYLTHSRAAHRLTGYLEEEAHRAYTDYLSSIDNGKIPNRAAPEIARNYYYLGEEATMRDVILHVRADEAMHRDVNHHFGNKYGDGDTDSSPGVAKCKDDSRT